MKNKISKGLTNLYIEKEKVAGITNKMKSESFFHDLAETFKAMSDPTRAKIIYALSLENELCVGDLAAVTGSTNSAISHQLKTLRNMKLVKYNKIGKLIFYSLDDMHINNLFAEGLRHVEEK
jgi:ArsR family transcriptional regulator, lead/cadmium/zinc/bismuth-responsive transcriptional repressor